MVKKILATSLYAKHHHDISDHLPKYHAMSVALMVTNLMMMMMMMMMTTMVVVGMDSEKKIV